MHIRMWVHAASLTRKVLMWHPGPSDRPAGCVKPPAPAGGLHQLPCPVHPASPSPAAEAVRHPAGLFPQWPHLQLRGQGHQLTGHWPCKQLCASGCAQASAHMCYALLLPLHAGGSGCQLLRSNIHGAMACLAVGLTE